MALENSKEITIEEIQELDKDSYLMVDIRDEVEISHGAIPGAVTVPADSLMPEHLTVPCREIYFRGQFKREKTHNLLHPRNQQHSAGGEIYRAGIRCSEPKRWLYIMAALYHGKAGAD